MPEIITRAEAKARGLKRYFTGGACKKGHLSEKYVSTGACAQCLRLGAPSRNAKRTKQQIRLENLKRYWANPEYYKERRKKYYHQNRDRIRREAKKKRRDGLDFISGWKVNRRERWNAKQEELKHYFTGIPCKHGHIANRKTSDGGCVVCCKIRAKGYRYNGPENPIGEMQWLRKNKAQLRQVKRALRNLGASQSQSAE